MHEIHLKIIIDHMSLALEDPKLEVNTHGGIKQYSLRLFWVILQCDLIIVAIVFFVHILFV